MTQVAGTDPEEVGIDAGEVGTRSGRRNHGERAARLAVHADRCQRRAGREVPYHRDDRRVVHELLGDANRDLGAAAVVHDPQRQMASTDPTAGVDFRDGQLGRLLHRLTAGLGKRPREPQDNRSAASTGTRRKRQDRNEEGPVPPHERARLSL